MLIEWWLSATLASSTLTACGHHDYPPWNWHADGKIVGVCAEVVSTLYQRLGLKVDLSYVGPWARCQQKVAAGEVDINICALRNEERSRYSRFTQTRPRWRSTTWRCLCASPATACCNNGRI